MSKKLKTEVTLDPEDWARNLRRADPDAPMDEDTFKRWRNNFFAFWAVCTAPACKRTKRCAGDPTACHDRLWPHVPERMKFEFHTTLKAINDGLPLEAVMQKVEEELARFDARSGEGERERAASADGPPPSSIEKERTEPAAAPPPRERPQPRVRML